MTQVKQGIKTKTTNFLKKYENDIFNALKRGKSVSLGTYINNKNKFPIQNKVNQRKT